MKFNIKCLSIPDIILIEPQIFNDSRGFFMESYNKREFESLGLNYDFVQDNHSLSIKTNTLRGLHYQLNPKAQTKLVRCTRGAILDVAVDIRKGSPYYGRYVNTILTE